MQCYCGRAIRIVGKEGGSKVLIDNRRPLKRAIDSGAPAYFFECNTLDLVLTIDIDASGGV